MDALVQSLFPRRQSTFLTCSLYHDQGEFSPEGTFFILLSFRGAPVHAEGKQFRKLRKHQFELTLFGCSSVARQAGRARARGDPRVHGSVSPRFQLGLGTGKELLTCCSNGAGSTSRSPSPQAAVFDKETQAAPTSRRPRSSCSRSSCSHSSCSRSSCSRSSRSRSRRRRRSSSRPRSQSAF